jgi:hypothetical protein
VSHVLPYYYLFIYCRRVRVVDIKSHVDPSPNKKYNHYPLHIWKCFWPQSSLSSLVEWDFIFGRSSWLVGRIKCFSHSPIIYMVILLKSPVAFKFPIRSPPFLFLLFFLFFFFWFVFWDSILVESVDQLWLEWC